MPMMLDGLISQLRSKHGQQWEFLNQGQGQAQMGGVRSAADARELARVGSADATLSNIGSSAMAGLGMMSGIGAVTTGLQGMGHLAAPDLIDSPMPNLTGTTPTSKKQLATITSDNPTKALNQARAAQRESYRQAVAERERRAKEMSDRANAGHRGGGFGKAGGGNRSSRGARGE